MKKGQDMTGNFSVLQEGSTLIGDHKTAVQALEEVLAHTTIEDAHAAATEALTKLGEPGYTEDDVKAAPDVSKLTTR